VDGTGLVMVPLIVVWSSVYFAPASGCDRGAGLSGRQLARWGHRDHAQHLVVHGRHHGRGITAKNGIPAAGPRRARRRRGRRARRASADAAMVAAANV
jgi:hypothetical protein